MGKQKSISNAPMVLGIIGGILGLPTAFCSGLCAAGISGFAQDATKQSIEESAYVFMWLGFIAALLGLISAFLYRSSPKLWGIVMLLAALLSGITLFTFNLMSFVICILFLIGGGIAVTQKKSSTTK